MKICIVGGVAGGAGAATKLRRLDEQAEIILFEKGEDISYANCGLPYYIGGEIKQKEALLVTPPALLRKRFRIDVRTSSEVTQIHPQEKVIQIRNHLTGESYTETYDKLILSPGASPKKFSIEGIDLPGIFTVRNVRNTLEIDEYIQKNQVNSCVVAGGGFIGVEMAENLRLRGMEVTLVEFTNQIMAPLDREMANILHQEIISKGVNLKLGTGVSKLESQSDHSLIVSLTDQSQIHCGMVVLAMGVTPENGLAQQAGLKLSVGNSIQVNEFFQTSNPDIYAVGDAIAVTHGVSGEEALISLAGPANRQGRSVAANVLGQHQTNGKIAYGSSVVKVFDLIAASVGLNEKQLAKSNQNYLKTYVHPFSHATYYPGATQISMKMLFAPDGKILGAQAVGAENVEKQIDVIATVMKFGGTVYDLEELELCYAPPFNSAKSPVNMLGFTAANILKGEMPVFYAEQIPQIDQENSIFVDVSTPPEVLMGTIPNAINIPLDELRERLSELDPNKKIYVTCRVGLRGNIATRILLQHGFDVYNLSGGYKTYRLVNTTFSQENP
ncbi:FAD-dependent oxidoreductase [Massilioclostridium coli]|uniref:FAD-dependent oxidoreductase n=1 Tax=Massilioclostridium coli TaxID=1870991 RepID=UPI0022DEB373|nr:FAD-dependent oxidoreductase [Massilioclostridium coli]